MEEMKDMQTLATEIYCGLRAIDHPNNRKSLAMRSKALKKIKSCHCASEREEICELIIGLYTQSLQSVTHQPEKLVQTFLHACAFYHMSLSDKSEHETARKIVNEFRSVFDMSAIKGTSEWAKLQLLDLIVSPEAKRNAFIKSYDSADEKIGKMNLKVSSQGKIIGKAHLYN